jgi:hypothetical protein
VRKQGVYKFWLILAMNQWLRRKRKSMFSPQRHRGHRENLFVVKSITICGKLHAA